MSGLYDKEGQRLYLTPAERLAFYEMVIAGENLRRKSVCLALIYTGCRVSEAMRLRRKHIDVADGTLVFETLKQRGKPIRRALPIPPSLITLLLQQAPDNPDGKIWPFTRYTTLRYVKKFMGLAGLDGKKATCKGLRHSFAIDCASNGVPLATISKWLGHAKMETTKIYLNFVGEEERALAERSWLHLPPTKPPIISEPVAANATEVKIFDLGPHPENQQDIINAHIKEREAAGWTVSKVEMLTAYDEYDGRKHPYTTGVMMIFVKQSGG